MTTESPPLVLDDPAPSVGVDSASRVLVRLGAERASLFAPVARALFEGLGAGGEVQLSADGLALAGPAGEGEARVAVATAIAGFAADLDRVRGSGPPARLQIAPRPVAMDGGRSFVLHGLLRHGAARGVDRHPEQVERFVHKVLLSAQGDGALARGPLFARLDAGEARLLAVFALVGDRALVRRLGGAGGFLEALRERAYRTFARAWTRPLAVEAPGDACGGGAVVAVRLPLVSVSRDDPQAYGTYLQGMLDASAHVAFVTMNEAYARTFPEGSALRAVCPDLGPRGDVRNLQLYCRPALQYECTRAALLGQLVHGCLARLAAAGATDGRLLSVDAWAVAAHPELEFYVAPSSAEECLWAFAGYVAEPSSGVGADAGPGDALARTVRRVELALARIGRARWWSPEAGGLQALPRVLVATDPSTGRRFYVSCAVIDSVEVCARWADAEVLRHAIEDAAGDVGANALH